jgi:hypothetical protein
MDNHSLQTQSKRIRVVLCAAVFAVAIATPSAGLAGGSWSKSTPDASWTSNIAPDASWTS